MATSDATTSTRPSLRIAELAITNFRTFRERTTISFRDDQGAADAIAVFHGDNGSGKSNALAAIDLFFQVAELVLGETRLRPDEDALLLWDTPYAANGATWQAMGPAARGRPLVVAYRDRPHGAQGSTVVEIEFADARLGRMQAICEPAGTEVALRLLRGSGPSSESTVGAGADRERRRQLFTWLRVPLNPGSTPVAIIDARRFQTGLSSAPRPSLLPPEIASTLLALRTSRQPDARNIWRFFADMLGDFVQFAGKEISVEVDPATNAPAFIVEERGRTVLALDELSSGEQHIVVLAATSLLANSAILAIQEPEISLDHANQRQLFGLLGRFVARGVPDQIILESHVPVFDGAHVIRFSRDAAGATQVRREPSREAAAREIERRAREQGAEPRWVTRDGYTQLPGGMIDELHLDEGGHVWFLKGERYWEAWPEANVDEIFRGAGEDDAR